MKPSSTQNMNHYTFILENETSATIVRVPAEDLLCAYVAVTVWMNTKPCRIESINYTSIRAVQSGKPLIDIPAEELRKLVRQNR